MLDRLHQRAAFAVRMQELRQQRQVHHRDFRVQQVGQEAHREQLARAVLRQVAHRERRTATRLQRLPGQVQQVQRAADAQRVIGERHGHQQGGDAQCRAQHVEHEAQRHPAQRDQARHRPLADRARDDVDHVRPGREHHGQRNQRKGQQVGSGGHGQSWQRAWRSVTPAAGAACAGTAAG